MYFDRFFQSDNMAKSYIMKYLTSKIKIGPDTEIIFE